MLVETNSMRIKTYKPGVQESAIVKTTYRIIQHLQEQQKEMETCQKNYQNNDYETSIVCEWLQRENLYSLGDIYDYFWIVHSVYLHRESQSNPGYTLTLADEVLRRARANMQLRIQCLVRHERRRQNVLEKKVMLQVEKEPDIDVAHLKQKIKRVSDGSHEFDEFGASNSYYNSYITTMAQALNAPYTKDMMNPRTAGSTGGIMCYKQNGDIFYAWITDETFFEPREIDATFLHNKFWVKRCIKHKKPSSINVKNILSKKSLRKTSVKTWCIRHSSDNTSHKPNGNQDTYEICTEKDSKNLRIVLCQKALLSDLAEQSCNSGVLNSSPCMQFSLDGHYTAGEVVGDFLIYIDLKYENRRASEREQLEIILEKKCEFENLTYVGPSQVYRVHQGVPNYTPPLQNTSYGPAICKILTNDCLKKVKSEFVTEKAVLECVSETVMSLHKFENIENIVLGCLQSSSDRVNYMKQKETAPHTINVPFYGQKELPFVDEFNIFHNFDFPRSHDNQDLRDIRRFYTERLHKCVSMMYIFAQKDEHWYEHGTLFQDCNLSVSVNELVTQRNLTKLQQQYIQAEMSSIVGEILDYESITRLYTAVCIEPFCWRLTKKKLE